MDSFTLFSPLSFHGQMNAFFYGTESVLCRCCLCFRFQALDGKDVYILYFWNVS